MRLRPGYNAPVSSKPGPILLVVDADRRMHQACESLFSAAGIVVRGVSTGEEALEEMRRNPPVALVTELWLPGMDGLTLLRQVRRERPALPLLVCTGAPSAAAASQAIRLGADDFVIKKRDTATHLRAAVRKAVARRARLAETERLLGELAELNDRFLEAMVELQRQNMELRTRSDALQSMRDGLRVMIVDDDPSIVAVLEALLHSQPDIQIVTANSGQEARAILAREAFDLLLTDLQLGDDNGVELATWLHKHHPSTAVVLMTGYATVDSVVAAIQHGVVGYLQKPFRDLDEVLGKVLEVKDKLQIERKEAAYHRAFQARNADFMARYRLIKTKLSTLQRVPT